MSDHIKREDAAKILLQRREFAENQEWTQEVDLMELLCERLDEVHAADVREVVRGEWEALEWGFKYLRCTSCGYEHRFIKFKFCPNCGADMRPEPGKEVET